MFAWPSSFNVYGYGLASSRPALFEPLRADPLASSPFLEERGLVREDPEVLKRAGEYPRRDRANHLGRNSSYAQRAGGAH
jgi:hypothetical protein